MDSQPNIIHYLEQTAREYPDRTAVVQMDKSITFGELRKQSRKTAVSVSAGISSAIRMPIGVYLPKGIDVIRADYGILYSGNYFLNLDIKAPEARNRKILNRLCPALIITSQDYNEQLQSIAPDCPTLLIETIELSGPAPDSLPWTQLTDADPFCILTTSGSTGTPKGVVLPHRGYIDNLNDTLDATGLHRSVKLLSVSPVDFDFFVYEICFIARSASTMYIVPGSYPLFPVKLLEYMAEVGIDYIEWVPSLMVAISKLDLLSQFPLPSLREVWYGGETFPTKHLNYWRRHLPGARFVHFYGPTEASYTCTYKILDRDYADDECVPIGKPFRNTRLLVLNNCDQPVGKGEDGELCVLGTRLAHGYYNDPEKTARAFVQNPLNQSYPEIMYRTGDLVRYTEDGELIFRGRADTMIKHQGFRIELADVDHAINALGVVSYACSMYNCEAEEITLFYEAEKEIAPAVLRKRLRQTLPGYMIPASFVRVDRLPRNTNDKIDRVRLQCMLPQKKD